MSSRSSTVPWSSASTVTNTPAAAAAPQMVCAFSSAIFRPCRGRHWPRAVSFNDTSRAPGGASNCDIPCRRLRYAATVADA
ncbi:Uncharacterised protein [Mycobacteroides abscessus subsp. abscessus]|nr:Uncharacterised protein [Mycobacteroides abscessus subsp. abscessus]